jgi:hypothetical protein
MILLSLNDTSRLQKQHLDKIQLQGTDMEVEHCPLDLRERLTFQARPKSYPPVPSGHEDRTRNPCKPSRLLPALV